MSSETRSFIRQLEQLIKQKEYEKAKQTLNETIIRSDSNRRFDETILILTRILDMDNITQIISKNKILYHIVIRKLLLNEHEDAVNYLQKIDEGLHFRKILEGLLYNSQDNNFILESIEYKNIFGNLEELKFTPIIKFAKEEDLFSVIEDVYPLGIYHLNYTDAQSVLHYSSILYNGVPDDLNIMEKRKIIKIA